MINENELKTHFAGDEELILELVTVFEETYPETISGIKNSIVKNDFKNLELHAHTLKGMIANFFAADLKDAAFELEKMGREQNIHDPDATIQKLESEIPNMVKELREMRWE